MTAVTEREIVRTQLATINRNRLGRMLDATARDREAAR